MAVRRPGVGMPAIIVACLTRLPASRWDLVYKPRSGQPTSNSAAGSAGSKSARWRSVGITGLSEPRVDPTALCRAIVESADDAITSTDLQETITSWNQAAERLYGYSAAETIGKSNRMIIPPDRCAEEDAVVRWLRGGEGVQHFETVRIHKNGTRVDVAITASAIRDDGSIIGISKIARDISSRKDSERNGARLAAIVESSDDAIIGKDLNGVITTWNPAAERIFGYPAHEAVGQSIRLIIPDSHQGEEDTILDASNAARARSILKRSAAGRMVRVSRFP